MLEDTGVALLPGSAFGRPEEEYTAGFRMLILMVPGLIAAAETIRPEDPIPDEFINAHCSHLLDGIKSIVGWTKSL